MVTILFAFSVLIVNAPYYGLHIRLWMYRTNYSDLFKKIQRTLSLSLNNFFSLSKLFFHFMFFYHVCPYPFASSFFILKILNSNSEKIQDG